MSLVGLIPAAGKGVRAYPYTETIPKSMLEVDGRPLIRRNVELMRDRLDIRDIRIVVGYQGDCIRRYLGDGSALGVRITYVLNERLDLELPYSVSLGGRGVETYCCAILADECYVDTNHEELLQHDYGSALVTCGLMVSDYGKEVRKNYAATVRDGLIVDLEEKPTGERGPMMGIGTYILHPDVFRRLEALYAGEPGRQPKDWTSWLATLARGGERILPFELRGRYVNINSGDDLNYANALVRDLTFDQKTTSLIHVIDDQQEAADRSLLRFSNVPDIDEVLAVARLRSPALDQAEATGKVRVVIAPNPNMPTGELTKLGLAQARGDILLLSYGDDTFTPRDIAKFLVYLRDADMVVGTRTTRQMMEQGTNMRGIVRASHIFLAKLLQILWWRFESRFTDICCLYRGMWRSTYETIRDNLSADGIETYPEMVVEVVRARRRIIEIPINYYNPDPGGRFVRSKYQHLATFRRIVELLIRKRLGDSFLGRWLFPRPLASALPQLHATDGNRAAPFPTLERHHDRPH